MMMLIIGDLKPNYAHLKMQSFYTILRLARLPNLFIIALVLYLQRFCIVIPQLQHRGFSLFWLGYSLIVLGTVLIAAGGYLINDLFDIGIDDVNRPDRAAILRSVSHNSIRFMYSIVTLAGLASIAMACFLSGTYILWLVYLIAALVLYWYSCRLKRVLILGNLAVALASAFTMPAAWLFDWLNMVGWNTDNPGGSNNYNEISLRILIYSLFAFIISFAREIIKDIEDIEGDSRYGCRSLPVVHGIPVAKRIIFACFVFILFMLFLWQIELFRTNNNDIALYLAIAVDLPLIWLMVLVFRIRSKADSHRAGVLTKVIMVTGILSMLWFLI
jgi:4-hydroxybenzoate polyprenyltransferase